MILLKNNNQSASILFSPAKYFTRFFTYITFLNSLLIFQIRPTNAEYISHYHQHNLTCVDWKNAPEAMAGNCTHYGKYGALRCYGGMNNLQSFNEQKVRRLEEVIFCGWPEKFFYPSIDLSPFPKIRTLTIEHSPNLTEIVEDFPEMFTLQIINISFTKLSHVNSDTFRRIYTLKVLDLRWNQLVNLAVPLILPRSFETLFLAGNLWNCTQNFTWIVLEPEKSAFIADRNDLICNDRKYKDRHLITVMQYEVLLKKECSLQSDLQNCTCTMEYIVPKKKEPNLYEPRYTVNCSNLQFLRLPSYIPANTTTLYANDNLITDISPLEKNEHYRTVEDVHLENNDIECIDSLTLDGGYWLNHFRLLNVRGNKLKKILNYAINNAFQDNHNANTLLLSKNPWDCSCEFAMRFRQLLRTWDGIVRDARNVTCAIKEDNKIRIADVLNIRIEDICEPHGEPSVYPLDILNCILASLIVFILAKLAYDYYYYKYYGRVPWIVMKIP